MRNGVKHAERCVTGALSQTYSPLEIIFSDQGSTDGTVELVEALVAKYKGPHTVRVLKAPPEVCDVPFSLAGHNINVNWAMTQTKATHISLCSIDDYSLSERVSTAMQAFKDTGASAVALAQYFEKPVSDPDNPRMYVTHHPKESGWLKPEEFARERVGGSVCATITRELWDAMSGLPEPVIPDLWLGWHAMLNKGYYYVYDFQHVYVDYENDVNAGLEQRIRAAQRRGEVLEALTLDEQAYADIAATMALVYIDAANHLKRGNKKAKPVMDTLMMALAQGALDWSMKRKRLEAVRSNRPTVLSFVT